MTITPGRLVASHRHQIIPLLMIIALIIALTVLTGCADQRVYAEADRLRIETVKPLVAERVERRPEEAQEWADWLATWQMSIDARSAE